MQSFLMLYLKVLTLPLYMGAFHTANRAIHSLAVETSVLQSL